MTISKCIKISFFFFFNSGICHKCSNRMLWRLRVVRTLILKVWQDAVARHYRRFAVCPALSVKQPSQRRQQAGTTLRRLAQCVGCRPPLCRLSAGGSPLRRTNTPNKEKEAQKSEHQGWFISRGTWLMWVWSSRPTRTSRTGSLGKVPWGKKTSTKWRTINS